MNSGYTSVVDISLCGRSWQLQRAADLETLWENMVENDFGDDERLPYWTEIWPSSLVLAEWLLTQCDRFFGQVCLDLGCGLGLTAMVGSWLGGRIVAMDYEPEALHFAQKNQSINDVPQILWSVMDWRQPALAAGCAPFIWGGDIMYEARFVRPVLSFLEHALAPGGVVWIAEPNRSVYQTFTEQLAGAGWQFAPVLSKDVAALYEQEKPVPVTLWELSR